MFFRDSGMASLCTKELLTRRSLSSACMYLSMKSRMVSHRAVKVGRESRGFKCCRNTCDAVLALHSRVAPLILVSSIPTGS
ncbi:unnamed protein product [Ixodes hexagonus]